MHKKTYTGSSVTFKKETRFTIDGFDYGIDKDLTVAGNNLESAMQNLVKNNHLMPITDHAGTLTITDTTVLGDQCKTSISSGFNEIKLDGNLAKRILLRDKYMNGCTSVTRHEECLNYQYTPTATTNTAAYLDWNQTASGINYNIFENVHDRILWNGTAGNIYIEGGTGYITLGTGYGGICVQQSPLEKLRDIIRSRKAPCILTSRQFLRQSTDIREIRARQTLRKVVGEQQYQSFIKNGFVTARAQSGRVYQIFPGGKATQVYENGNKTESLCIVLKGKFPPTDSVIMRYLLILNDEQSFRTTSCRQSVHAKPTLPTIDSRNLAAIYAELKSKAA